MPFGCSCPNAAGLFMAPVALNSRTVEAIRKISGISMYNDLDVTFYYESTVKALNVAR